MSKENYLTELKNRLIEIQSEAEFIVQEIAELEQNGDYQPWEDIERERQSILND